MLKTTIGIAKKCAKRLRKGLGLDLLHGLTRQQYKQVWNRYATNEQRAMMVVQGSTSETAFDKTARDTLTMLQECVGVKRDDIVLEIGAGVGRVGRVLAPLCQRWIGADVSENMLGHIRRRLADLPNVDTAPLTGYELSGIPSASVTLVYCTVVFMHLSEWERYRYVTEGLRVLKPGGRMLVDNFNLLSEEGWQMFMHHVQKPVGERGPADSQSSTPQELAAYFQRAGFQNIRQRDGTSPLMIATFGTKAT